MRTIILSTASQKTLALKAIENLPILQKPFEIVIRQHVKQRSTQSNRYYWKRLSEGAEQAYFNGRKFGEDIWHDYLRETLLPAMIENKSGEMVSKWKERPDGKLVIISSTELSDRQFAEYTLAVTAFFADLGVQFSERET